MGEGRRLPRSEKKEISCSVQLKGEEGRQVTHLLKRGKNRQ